MRIGIDVDDTLNALSIPWAKWIQANHDPEFSLEKWTDWDLLKCTKAGEEIYEYLRLPGTFFHVPVRQNAQRVTARLAAQHDIYLITAFHHFDHGLKDKCQWINTFFPHISPKRVIYCNEKSLVSVDVLIDDGAHNFNGFNGFPILMERNWNKQANIPTKARTWEDVEKVFEGLRWLK